MKKKRIIFDIDGTIIPKVDFYLSIKLMLDYFNIEHQESDILRYKEAMLTYEDYYNSYKIEDYYYHLKKESGIDITMECIKYYLDHPEHLLPEKMDESIIDTLEYLKKKKYDMVVLTNYFKSVQEERLRLLGLNKYINQVYGGEMSIKPDVLAFLHAKGGYHNNECVMIGDDYEKDIEGALYAGIDTIYVNQKLNNQKEISDISCLKKLL